MSGEAGNITTFRPKLLVASPLNCHGADKIAGYAGLTTEWWVRQSFFSRKFKGLLYILIRSNLSRPIDFTMFGADISCWEIPPLGCSGRHWSITYLFHNLGSKDIIGHKKHTRNSHLCREVLLYPQFVSLDGWILWCPKFIYSVLLCKLENT